MQFTLTVAGLGETAAHALAAVIEAAEVPPLAVAVNEVDESAKIWNVVAYFADETQASGCARLLVASSGDVTVAPLPEIDWVRRSLEGLSPVAAGRFYLHGRHDRAHRRPGGISLEIDAGTAFGTGHHATTMGCLLVLDDILKHKSPRQILDVGCGTGVLAIATAKALKSAVLANDIDPVATSVTLLNARANDVAPLVTAITAPGLKHRRIAAAAPFDLIFANILALPLVALAGDLSATLAPGGTLVLSGLTHDQEALVRAAYRNRGLIPRPPRRIGIWSTLVFDKKGKRPRRFRRGRQMAAQLRRLGTGLVAPHHPVDFRTAHADIGKQPVIERLQLALGPAARHIVDDAAGDAGQKVGNEMGAVAAGLAGESGRGHGLLLFVTPDQRPLGYRTR
jgi:ribosomal protein L11 methyltransferase